jgi:hypothetical protein
MNIRFYLMASVILFLVLIQNTRAQAQARYLVLDFYFHGAAFGKSSDIGDSLNYLRKSGANAVSADLVSKVIARRDLNRSDLNYIQNDLVTLMNDLNADVAVYGHILSLFDILTVELRLLEKGQTKPFLFDPIVCGQLTDIYKTVPRMAELILAPDKSAPLVLSVVPPDGEKNIEQYIDMKITFSKPMNPATFSIAGTPESMWKKYGAVVYDEKTYTFTFKLHLYPRIDYEFHVNGAEAKGFKDEHGNVAPEYVWKFTTGNW